MYQTPRTPHARDNASLDPGQDADDADRENDDLYGDENVDTGREQEAPPTGKRGRSPNWLPCELAAAFLCRQHAVREKGCQSKLVERQNAATRVYSSIIHTLDDLGLCVGEVLHVGRFAPVYTAREYTKTRLENAECAFGIFSH